MFKEIDCHNAGYNDMEMGLSGLTRRAATKDEIKQSKIRQNETKMRGLPPWAGLESINTCDGDVDSQQTSVLKSSRTLRQWADEYCASNKLLKEFTYEKVHTHPLRSYASRSLRTDRMWLEFPQPPFCNRRCCQVYLLL